tara:strand:+ start:890 stop:1264 length:375 start_codon:yes stop_codon:yes gene_type:complete
MSNLTKFNLTLENLINDLILVFPDYKNLLIFKEKFILLKGSNPRIIMTYFKNTVFQYKEQINNKDNNFFLEKDYDEDVYIENEQWALDEVLNLKVLWKKLTEENKETVWSYFQILIKLCELDQS